MESKVGKLTFTVPDDSPVESERGTKQEKPFTYAVCQTEQEAEQTMAQKKWKLLAMVNDALKSNARANAYQSALLPHKPSEVPQEDIVERMVRDYIRLGVPEDIARKQVAGILAMGAAGTETTGADEVPPEVE